MKDLPSQEVVVHECGHALVAYLSPTVKSVTITFGPQGGCTKLERQPLSINLEAVVVAAQLETSIALAGVAAEFEVYGKVVLMGNQSDVTKALECVRLMITIYKGLEALSGENVISEILAKAQHQRPSVFPTFRCGALFPCELTPEESTLLQSAFDTAHQIVVKNVHAFAGLVRVAREKRGLQHEDLQARIWSTVEGSGQ